MVRSSKGVDWSKHLTPADRACIGGTIDPGGWYPMETFERLGLGILAEVARGQLDGVRMWGRFQVHTVIDAYPDLVVAGDPYQSMMRFRVFSRSFFDFDAIDVHTVEEGRAEIAIGYRMSPAAEETACHQTLGFFEGLTQRAGAADIAARFTARSWEGAPRSWSRNIGMPCWSRGRPSRSASSRPSTSAWTTRSPPR